MTLDPEKSTVAVQDIINAIGEYLPPDSGITPNDALSTVIGIIETQ